MSKIRLFLSTLGLVLIANSADAYRVKSCDLGILGSSDIKFPSNSATVRFSTASFPVGAWRDAMNNGFTQFNKNPSNFRLTQLAATASINLSNGRNEIWGSSSQQILDGAPAVAYTWRNCYWFFGVVAEVTESDVIFDYTNTTANPFEWQNSRAKTGLWRYGVTSGNPGRLLQTTQLHELGHLAGLQHEGRYYNVMGVDFEHVGTTGGNVIAYLGEDAATGLVALYGVRSTYGQDVAVAHWRHVGSLEGGYSDHGRTRLFNSSGTELGSTTVGAEPRYNVTRGATVQAEFIYENLGRSNQTNVPVSFRISTDQSITTSDTQIATTTISSLARGLPDRLRHTMTIPANLAAATDYWLGVIINPADTTPASESDRTNNTSYIRIRTN